MAFRRAGLSVLAALALAGCDGRVPSPGTALEHAISGSVLGKKPAAAKAPCTTGGCELMDAFEAAYPETYADFRLVYNQERRKLGNDDRAWRLAVPYLEHALAEKMLQASDEDIRALLDLTLERMAQQNVLKRPQLCPQVASDPAAALRVDSEELQDRHVRLQAKIMRTAMPDSALPAASEEETLAWITAFAKSHREHVEGLLIARRRVFTAKQAKLVCDYAKAQWQYLRDEPDGRIGALFRGIRMMADDDPFEQPVQRIKVTAPQPAGPAEAEEKPADKP